jgi:RNA polymerase sigma-70 factor (ECF subfamily)
MTDEQLMTAFQGGDDSAFEQLYDRYRKPIFHYLYRRIGDSGRAEELAQEVFMGLVRSRGRWRQEASFKTYLYRIAFNQSASEARRADFKSSEPLERADGSQIEIESTSPAPDAVANSRQEAALIVEALGELDADQREAIVLREYQGLSYEEIAEITGVAVGTVKSRIFRGKLDLKRLLEPILGSRSDESPGGHVVPLRSPSR